MPSDDIPLRVLVLLLELLKSGELPELLRRSEPPKRVVSGWVYPSFALYI